MAGRTSGFPAAIPVTRLNHISLNCSAVEASLQFYRDVLGFSQIKRPGSFDFDGAWLFNYGMGIHLLKDDNMKPGSGRCIEINPKSDHISFQCCNMEDVERSLHEHRVRFKRQQVKEGGFLVDQLFFHDPDGHMIEVCNCDVLPIVLIEASAQHQQQQLHEQQQQQQLRLQQQPCPFLTDASSAAESASTGDGGDVSDGEARPLESLTAGHELEQGGISSDADSSRAAPSETSILDNALLERRPKDSVLEIHVQLPKDKVLEVDMQSSRSQDPLLRSLSSRNVVLSQDPLLSDVLEMSAPYPESKRKRGEFAVCA